MRDKWDEKIFAPIEKATKRIIDISETLHRIETRVFDLEEVYKKYNLEGLHNRLEKVETNTAYTQFKLRLHSQYSKKAIFILDANGECEYVNQTLCELMGTDSSELEGKNWLKKIIVSERGMVEAEWADAYKNKRKFDMEQTVKSKTGIKKIQVEAEPFIYLNSVNKFFGVISVIN